MDNQFWQGEKKKNNTKPNKQPPPEQKKSAINNFPEIMLLCFPMSEEYSKTFF